MSRTADSADFPYISVITPVLNADKTLAECIKSVSGQTYSNLEHIIIDGGSTDSSLDIIKYHSEKIAYWHSKPDKGISDAFNQGIQQARGDYLYFLGASDTLYAKEVMARLIEGVPEGTMMVCGRVQRIEEETGVPLWIAPKKAPKHYNKWTLLKCLTLPHQGLLMHRNYFEEYGYFDLQWRYAMDYELILRSFHQFRKVVFKDIVVANWRAGGIGAHHLSRVLDEYHNMKLKYKIAPVWVLSVINILIRCRYALS
jgi:glycosyltransferase involved in cell wall biosynthesis